jgi:hypothetical protein
MGITVINKNYIKEEIKCGGMLATTELRIVCLPKTIKIKIYNMKVVHRPYTYICIYTQIRHQNFI